MDLEADMAENITFSMEDTLLLRPVDTNHSPSPSKDESNNFSLGFIGSKLVNADIDGGALLMEVVSAVDTLTEMEHTTHSIRSKNDKNDDKALEHDLIEIPESDEHVSHYQTVLEKDFTLTELVAVRAVLSENEESANKSLETCEITNNQTEQENDLHENEYDTEVGTLSKNVKRKPPLNKPVSYIGKPHVTEVCTLKKNVKHTSSHNKIVSSVVKPSEVYLLNMCDESMNKETKTHSPTNTFSLISKDEYFNFHEDNKRGKKMGYEKLPKLMIKLKRCDSLVGIKVLSQEETCNNVLQLNNSIASVVTRTRLSKGKVTDAATVSTNTALIKGEKFAHTEQLAENKEQTDSVPRRRGRPRKLFKQENLFKVPRKRGRPKKIIDNIQAENSDDTNLPITMSKVAHVYSLNEYTTLKTFYVNPESSVTSSPIETCSSSEKVHSDKPFVKRKKTSSSNQTCSSSETVNSDKPFVKRKKTSSSNQTCSSSKTVNSDKLFVKRKKTSSFTETCSSSEKVNSDKLFVKRKKTSSSTETCSSSEKVNSDKLFVEGKRRGRPKKSGQQHSCGLTFSKAEKNANNLMFNRNSSMIAVSKSNLKAKGFSRSQLVINLKTLFNNNKRVLRKSLLTQGMQLRPKVEIPKRDGDMNKQKQATVTKEKTKKLNSSTSQSPPHNPTQPILEIDRDPEVDIETVMNFEAEKSKERELLKTRRRPTRGRYVLSRKEQAAQDTSPYPVSLVYVKPTILKQCDLSHICCKQNAVSKVDQSTQWENILSDPPIPVLYANTFNLSPKVQVETSFVNSLPKNSAPSLQVVQGSYGHIKSLLNSSTTSLPCFKIGPAKSLVNSPMSSLLSSQSEQMNSPTSSSTSTMPSSNSELNQGANSLRYILPKHQAMENLDFASTQINQNSQVVQTGQFYTAVQVPFNLCQVTESSVYLMPSSNVIGDKIAVSNTPAISLAYQLQQPCVTPNINQSPIHTQPLPTSRMNMNSLFHSFRYRNTRGRKSKGNKGRPTKRKIPKEVKIKELQTVPFTPNSPVDSVMSTNTVTINSTADGFMSTNTSTANATPDSFILADTLAASIFEDSLVSSNDSRPTADITETGSNTINNGSQNLDTAFPDNNSVVQPDSLECIFID